MLDPTGRWGGVGCRFAVDVAPAGDVWRPRPGFPDGARVCGNGSGGNGLRGASSAARNRFAAGRGCGCADPVFHGVLANGGLLAEDEELMGLVAWIDEQTRQDCWSGFGGE